MIIQGGQKGFTIVEMIVVVAIIGVLLSTYLLNRQGGIDTVELDSAAYEAALVMRTAQTMGSNGRVHIDAAHPDGHVVPYGIYIVPNTQSFLVFADEDISLSYTSGEDTVGMYNTPTQKVRIGKFCVSDQEGNTPECSDEKGYVSLHIAYARPDVTPFFSVYRSGNNLVGKNYKQAIIYLVSDAGDEQGIVVDAEGLIYVKD